MLDRPELQQKIGLRMEWPGITNWLRTYTPKELLRLKTGDLAWFLTKNEKLECVKIIKTSHRLHIKTTPELRGIQVFFSGHTVSGGPCLFLDGEPITLFKITDLEEAHLHHRS